MQSVPSVEHAHIQHLVLLRKVVPALRLNDGPFRVLHLLAYCVFTYLWYYEPSAASGATDLSANATDWADELDAQPAHGLNTAPDPAVDTTDELDTVVFTAEVNSTAAADKADDFEIWEPKTPKDYALIAWALVALAHALFNLFCVWMVRWKVLCQYKKVQALADADHILCVPTANHGDPAIVAIGSRLIKDPATGSKVQQTEFEFRRIRFELHDEGNIFRPVQFPDSEPLERYLTSSGYESEDAALAALEKWGSNTVNVPVPAFMQMLKEQMMAPFFVFQVFCVLLWCIDSYLYYSLFTLGMLVVFECTVVMQRQRSLNDLRAIQVPKPHVEVLRGGKWSKIPGEMLLPGDVFFLTLPPRTSTDDDDADAALVPVDALLLGGGVIADESVLTGESTPQWKEPIAGGDAASAERFRPLDVTRDKLHVLFGGTKIRNVTAGELPDGRGGAPGGGAPAVVLRTGFETAQGRLMRTILMSTERLTANTVESGLFICFLLLFAVSAAGYILYYGLQDPPEKRSRFRLYLSCTMVVTSVIPPELPMQLTMAVNQSLMALRKKAIYCTEPFRIPYAGKTEVCCFDKTGTLTSDHLVLKGLTTPSQTSSVPPAADIGMSSRSTRNNGSDTGSAVTTADDGIEADAKQWPTEALMVLAACHSLMNINGDIVGDPLEKAAFMATQWLLQGSQTAPTYVDKQGQGNTVIAPLHKFHFSSELKRMAVVVKVTTNARTPREQVQSWVFVKGAPEVIQRHLATCPPGYQTAHQRFAAQGFRMIALAAKRMDSTVTASTARAMARDEAEAGLDFVGLAVFEAPLKEQSEPALRMLQQSSHQLVMITGDAPLTACYTAKQVHIVDRPVAILTCDQPGATSSGHAEVDPADEHFSWRGVDNTLMATFSRKPADVVILARRFDLCVTGDGLAHCERASIADVVVGCTQVFARVSPDQKEAILKAHRAAGRTALMCGDGTNDVGALKAAHVGIALMAPPSAKKIAAAREAIRARREARGRVRCGRKAGGRGPGAAAMCTGSSSQLSSVQIQQMTSGVPAPPKPTKDSKGNDLPGTKLIKQMEAQGKPVPASMRKMADWLDSQGADQDMTGGVPLLKPGDASMASPFTIKADDVMPATEIIKQGRCTLVTTVQMFKILGLSCLSTAYNLSVLNLAGVKLGDVQATCQGLFSAGLFYFVANAAPAKVLSRTRPHQSVFSKYVMSSLLLQFGLQIGLIIYMFLRARALTPLEERGTVDSDFKPNLVNTVCWLVQNATQLLTFAVNYVGHPFQQSLLENKGMIGSLRMSIFGLLVVSSGLVPFINQKVQLVDVPAGLKVEMFAGVLFVIVASVVAENRLRFAFPAAVPPRKGYMSWLHLLPNAQEPKKLR